MIKYELKFADFQNNKNYLIRKRNLYNINVYVSKITESSLCHFFAYKFYRYNK